MKTIAITAVAALALGIAPAADKQSAQPAAEQDVKKIVIRERDKMKELTPEEKEAKIAERKRKRQEREEARRQKMAEAAGMTVEEWSKLDNEAKNVAMRKVIQAKMLERDQRAAKKAGVSLEEYRRQRDERRKAKKSGACAAKPAQGAKLVDDPKNTEAGK